MIGTLLVYGNQQWKREGLAGCDMEEISFLYHCIAFVKRKEAEAVAAERKRLEEEAGRG